jgi:hypothetical protein
VLRDAIVNTATCGCGGIGSFTTRDGQRARKHKDFAE